MITERTLKKWRMAALAELEYLKGWDSASERSKVIRTHCERELRLTQELLDIHLLQQVKHLKEDV